MDIQVGDTLQMKKPHPCGCKEWEELPIGMDIRMRCKGCRRDVLLPRTKAEKNVKNYLPGPNRQPPD